MSEDEALLLLLIPLGFLVVFPLFWMFVSALIGSISGWQSLSASYRENTPFEGQTLSFQSGSMRWGMGYRSTLTIGATPLGLHLSVLLPFRIGHPPLFVRWDEITRGTGQFGFGKGCRFEFRASPGASLTISAELAEKLKAQAGTAWPRERVEPT